ncbi:hypothetical protein CEXT_288601 [Caerostris extrusa]|uniref:Uncharacterized protein n=1 Tax=Caerostris extrusa TaxID=172846 RepID=A0AAV4STW9_CAEEX|nr:hypothetical protein CEXT_288601 [Caerostris extrusa]
MNFYTEENNLFASCYWCLFFEYEDLLYEENNLLFLHPVTGVLSKTRMLEIFFYTEENNLFLYPVTGALFEAEVVGGNFLYRGKIIFFFISIYWCPFRRRGGWRKILIP